MVSDVLQPKMMVRMIVRSNDTPENYQTIENVQMNSIVHGLTSNIYQQRFQVWTTFYTQTIFAVS